MNRPPLTLALSSVLAAQVDHRSRLGLLATLHPGRTLAPAPASNPYAGDDETPLATVIPLPRIIPLPRQLHPRHESPDHDPSAA